MTRATLLLILSVLFSQTAMAQTPSLARTMHLPPGVVELRLGGGISHELPSTLSPRVDLGGRWGVMPNLELGFPLFMTLRVPSSIGQTLVGAGVSGIGFSSAEALITQTRLTLTQWIDVTRHWAVVGQLGGTFTSSWLSLSRDRDLRATMGVHWQPHERVQLALSGGVARRARYTTRIQETALILGSGVDGPSPAPTIRVRLLGGLHAYTSHGLVWLPVTQRLGHSHSIGVQWFL